MHIILKCCIFLLISSSKEAILAFYHNFLTLAIMKEIQTQLARIVLSIKKVTYIMERTPCDLHCRV